MMCPVHLEPIDGAWFELAVAFAVSVFAILSPNLSIKRRLLDKRQGRCKKVG